MEAWGRGRCIFQLYHIFCPAFLPVYNSCCFVLWLSPLLLVLEQTRPVRGTYPMTGSCRPGNFEIRVMWFIPACQHFSGEQLERRQGLSALPFARNLYVWPLVEQKVTSVTRGLTLSLCSSFQYENYCKTRQQLLELKILFLSHSKFLFQNKLWNRCWNTSQTTWKWIWRVYCLSSKDPCRATTWV